MQKGRDFSFDFGWYSIQLDIVCLEQGGRGYLTDKIC